MWGDPVACEHRRSQTKERSEMSQYESGPEPQVSGWAVAGATFAATMMILIGIFQFIAGLAAVINDDFYVVAQNYAFDLDVSGWGWIHMIVGILLAVGGFFLFAGRAWAAVFAIVLAGLSALVNFFFIPYYPFWSILVIALDVWVIWALTRPGVTEA
jgi:hypothetical protein